MNELQMFLQALKQPEYRHVLLNPVPMYGLATGLLALVLALLLKSRPARVVAMVLIAVACASVWPVVRSGHAGYDRVTAMSNADAKQWLDVHQHRADRVKYVFYLTGLLALAALIAEWKFPKTAIPLALATMVLVSVGLCLSGFGLGALGLGRRIARILLLRSVCLLRAELRTDVGAAVHADRCMAVEHRARLLSALLRLAVRPPRRGCHDLGDLLAHAETRGRPDDPRARSVASKPEPIEEGSTVSATARYSPTPPVATIVDTICRLFDEGIRTGTTPRSTAPFRTRRIGSCFPGSPSATSRKSRPVRSNTAHESFGASGSSRRDTRSSKPSRIPSILQWWAPYCSASCSSDGRSTPSDASATFKPVSGLTASGRGVGGIVVGSGRSGFGVSFALAASVTVADGFIPTPLFCTQLVTSRMIVNAILM